jgi:hypothetical protein
MTLISRRKAWWQLTGPIRKIFGKIATENCCCGHDNCPEGLCCVCGACVDPGCPALESLSCAWCGTGGGYISAYPMNGLAAYGPVLDPYGWPCWIHPSSGIYEADAWWIVGGESPDEIQEPGGSYALPVPGVDPPSGRTCRYVWRYFTGRGRQSYTDPNDPWGSMPETATPTACDIYSLQAWLLYSDIDRCTRLEGLNGGWTAGVLDTAYDFSSWPMNDPSNGCWCAPPFLAGTDCSATAPVISFSLDPLPCCE